MTMAARRGRFPPLSPARPEEILLPVRPWFVALTIVAAFLLNMVPVAGMVGLARPDFVALVILYWCIQEPRLVGVGVAWVLGLVMDVANATLFGQHAFAYALLALAAGFFRRRVLRFPLWHQALHVAALLGGALVLVFLIRRVGGAAPAPPAYFLSALTGALLWPFMTVILQWPQRPAASSTEF